MSKIKELDGILTAYKLVISKELKICNFFPFQADSRKSNKLKKKHKRHNSIKLDQLKLKLIFAQSEENTKTSSMYQSYSLISGPEKIKAVLFL